MVEKQLAADFISSLTSEQQDQLFNDLLAVEEVYRTNQNTNFYTFRKLRQATKRHFECRKRTFQYINQRNDELVIQQIHEQRIFRNHYYFKIYFNLQEYDISLVENLLAQLRENRIQHFVSQNLTLA